jgi:hypothetical protein
MLRLFGADALRPGRSREVRGVIGAFSDSDFVYARLKYYF